MNSNKNHFLDTSIVLTGLIKWRKEEFHEKANQYFEDRKFIRITSIRVFSEAQSVMNNSRRIYSQFLQKMYENPSVIRTSDLEGSMIFEAKKLFKKPFEQRIITAFIRNSSATIFSAVSTDAETFQKYLTQIAQEIHKGILELMIVCQPRQGAKIARFDRCPSDHSKYYPNDFQVLESKINYPPDTEVILDAYFISNKIKHNISLITLDNEHMLSNKSHIEATLQTIKVCDFRQY